MIAREEEVLAVVQGAVDYSVHYLGTCSISASQIVFFLFIHLGIHRCVSVAKFARITWYSHPYLA